MDTELINPSPARRARRCILNLLVLSIFAVGAYVGLRSDRSTFRSIGTAVSGSDARLAQKSSSATTQPAASTKEAPIKVSMTSSIASANLVAEPRSPATIRYAITEYAQQTKD